jgi:hypothetical protein
MRDTCVQCGKPLSDFLKANPCIEHQPSYTGPDRRRVVEACSLECAQRWSDEHPWPDQEAA